MLHKDEVDVVVVLDGRPGHEKQSNGIVGALGGLIKVNTHIIDVSNRGFWAQCWAYVELMLGVPPRGIELPDKADLVIGTGTRTHATILTIKKHFGVKAATCMTPGKHLRSLFDICFVPEHDGVSKRDNYFFTTGAPNGNINKGLHESNSGLILIGGVDEKSHDWNSEDIVKKINLVVARDQSIHWTISSSPRTPQETIQLLQKKMELHSNCSFCDYKNTPRGWVEEQYEKSSTVWVTADSISMIYEALSSGCKVNIFPMDWKRSTSKFKRNEDVLISKKLVTSFHHWEQGSSNLTGSNHLNEAQRCAEYILQECWPQN